MTAPTVFISYSHLDEGWMKRLLPQLHALEQAGVDMQVWHDRKIDGGAKWYPEIVEAMANAAAAVLLISPDFLASTFCIQEDVVSCAIRPSMRSSAAWRANRRGCASSRRESPSSA